MTWVLAGQALYLDSLTLGMWDIRPWNSLVLFICPMRPSSIWKSNPLCPQGATLVSLLAEANYHRFYIWPTGINGDIRITGNPDDLLIRGNFTSDQGPLKAETIVKNDSLNGLFFSLDIPK